MEPTRKELEESVRKQVEEIVASSRDVQARIAHLVRDMAREFHFNGAGLVALTKSVMDGAAAAFDKAVPKQPDSVLGQVVEGLGDGLSSASLAARLALEESEAASKSFATEDLSKLSKDLSALKSLFVETVSEAAGKLRSGVAGQAGNLRGHAERAYNRVRPALDAAVTAAAQHPVDLAKESVGAGLSLSGQAAGALFTAIGKCMQETGKRLEGAKK